MRKILLAIILLSSLSVFTAQAQFMNKGALGIGGSASIDVDPFVLQLSPNAAYYIIDNLGVGGEVSLTAADGYTSFGIGPFVRYYLNMGVFWASWVTVCQFWRLRILYALWFWCRLLLVFK
jgi:hypothetical protein